MLTNVVSHLQFSNIKRLARGTKSVSDNLIGPFSIFRAHHRAKDVLYLMARLYHMLGVYQDRNQVSAELKRLEDQYTTNGASQLAIML